MSIEVKAKQKSGFILVVIPTTIFLVFFFGMPIVLFVIVRDAGGGTIAIGLLIGLILGFVIAVVTYPTICALLSKDVKFFFRNSMLVLQSGKKEKAFDFSKKHVSEIEAGISPTGISLIAIGIQQGKHTIRIAGMNYSRQRAIQKFQDEKYINDCPISPFEGMSAYEIDANNIESSAFIDDLLSLLWEYRNVDDGYQYHAHLPWDEKISPQFFKVKKIQGEEAYTLNHTLIENIKNTSLYSIEGRKDMYLFINRDYLMITPSKKINTKLITRIIPLGVFYMEFVRDFKRADSDNWEYIKIHGIDESGVPYKEEVRFSVYDMKDLYKAKIMKRYLKQRNLVKEL